MARPSDRRHRCAVLGVVLACLGGAGCRSKKHLDVPVGCGDPAVVACLQRYAFERLSESDVERIAVDALAKCFATDKAALALQARCLPLNMGVDRRNGRAVTLRYFCSDLCPDAGGVLPMYLGVTNVEQCCELGGFPFKDPAWGHHFRGCGVASSAWKNLRSTCSDRP